MLFGIIQLFTFILWENRKNIANLKEFLLLRYLIDGSLYTLMPWERWRSSSKLHFNAFIKGRFFFPYFFTFLNKETMWVTQINFPELAHSVCLFYKDIPLGLQVEGTALLMRFTISFTLSTRTILHQWH